MRTILVLGVALVVGVLAGSVGVYLPLQGQLSSERAEVTQLREELDRLRLASRAVIDLFPGEGDNAPLTSTWSGQTGRVRYALASTEGFDYIVEMEKMPPEQGFYVYFAIALAGENPLENTQKAGEVTTDVFGRATLSGVIPFAAGVYNWGTFISHVDDPAPPYTHRTWICTIQAASFEVLPR